MRNRDLESLKKKVKTCTRCLQEKPFVAFSTNGTGPFNRATRCKVCRNELSRLRYEDPSVKSKHKISNQKSRLKRKKRQTKKKERYLAHGMTGPQYKLMLLKQRDGCAICRTKNVLLCVDHDHSCCSGQYSCGKCVRGLLCSRCNMGLGQFHDDLLLVKRCVRYLKETKEITMPINMPNLVVPYQALSDAA